MSDHTVPMERSKGLPSDTRSVRDDAVRKFDCDVLIVGAGVAGASSLHHILQHTDSSKRVMIVDAGSEPGLGFVSSPSSTSDTVAPRYSGSAVLMDSSKQRSDDREISDAITLQENRSSKIIKMMVQIFACSLESFVQHHGEDGAQTYLECTKEGLRIQKDLAKQLEILTSDESERSQCTLIKELGSMYLAYENDALELRKEYERFVSLSKDSTVLENIEWFERESEESKILAQVSYISDEPKTSVFYSGGAKRQILMNDCPFACGIYFPNDAIIDSSLYAKLLVKHATDKMQHDQKDRVHVMMNTKVSRIRRIQENQPGNLCGLIDGKGAVVEGYDVCTMQKVEIQCRHVVVATGGLSIAEGCCTNDLVGLLQPCYSYLAHVPMSKAMVWKTRSSVDQQNENDATFSSAGQNFGSPNFFTWKFTHDWCYTDKNHIRVSGEDHYSALKESRYQERCSNLINWTYQQYSDDGVNGNARVGGSFDTPTFDEKIVPQQYGVYTETPDYAPLIGFVANDDTVCYIVGCNAWGQTILSFSASLIPAILGYRSFTPFEDQAMILLSIQRFPYSMNSNNM